MYYLLVVRQDIPYPCGGSCPCWSRAACSPRTNVPYCSEGAEAGEAEGVRTLVPTTDPGGRRREQQQQPRLLSSGTTRHPRRSVGTEVDVVVVVVVDVWYGRGGGGLPRPSSVGCRQQDRLRRERRRDPPPASSSSSKQRRRTTCLPQRPSSQRLLWHWHGRRRICLPPPHPPRMDGGDTCHEHRCPSKRRSCAPPCGVCPLPGSGGIAAPGGDEGGRKAGVYASAASGRNLSPSVASGRPFVSNGRLDLACPRRVDRCVALRCVRPRRCRSQPPPQPTAAASLLLLLLLLLERRCWREGGAGRPRSWLVLELPCTPGGCCCCCCCCPPAGTDHGHDGRQAKCVGQQHVAAIPM
jgi:hypothetical protein